MPAAAAVDDDLWAAVGDPSRRRVLDLLVTQGSASSSGLAQHLPLTRQAVAKHLTVLDRVGLIEGRRRGREVRYVVQPDRLAEASRALSAAAQQWDRRLAAIKRIAEAIHREEQER
jgi:DNA-binding transcriptional ArsR family regulator